MKKTLTLSLLLSGLIAGAALAQDVPVETIYSDAQRAKDLTVSQHMVDLMLAPSFSIDGQFARWKRGICPHVYGLTPVTAWFIEHRIREVATMVGAPVDRDDPCIPDIGIIFTSQPQASLMSIADKRPFLLQGGSQKLEVKYPVQAWYADWKTDNDGYKTIDIPWDVADPWRDTAPQVAANDSRLHTGLTTEMGAATVLVDNKAAMGMTLGELADYLAFMTLAQASQYGACLPVETISNLLTPGCGNDDTAHRLSHADIALLTALYQVPDNPELLQKQRIVGAMRRSLEEQYGKE